jgi:hypothetical protein
MKTKDYVVVTAISSHRVRYVMHRDDLQKLSPAQGDCSFQLMLLSGLTIQ